MNIILELSTRGTRVGTYKGELTLQLENMPKGAQRFLFVVSNYQKRKQQIEIKTSDGKVFIRLEGPVGKGTSQQGLSKPQMAVMDLLRFGLMQTVPRIQASFKNDPNVQTAANAWERLIPEFMIEDAIKLTVSHDDPFVNECIREIFGK